MLVKTERVYVPVSVEQESVFLGESHIHHFHVEWGSQWLECILCMNRSSKPASIPESTETDVVSVLVCDDAGVQFGHEHSVDIKILELVYEILVIRDALDGYALRKLPIVAVGIAEDVVAVRAPREQLGAGRVVWVGQRTVDSEIVKVESGVAFSVLDRKIDVVSREEEPGESDRGAWRACQRSLRATRST